MKKFAMKIPVTKTRGNSFTSKKDFEEEDRSSSERASKSKRGKKDRKDDRCTKNLPTSSYRD